MDLEFKLCVQLEFQRFDLKSSTGNISIPKYQTQQALNCKVFDKRTSTGNLSIPKYQTQ